MFDFDRYGRLAIFAALVVALGLGGCGRKGPLDAPPSAAIAGAPAVAQPEASPSDGFLLGRPAEPPPPEAPTAAAPRKSFFLDWLLN